MVTNNPLQEEKLSNLTFPYRLTPKKDWNLINCFVLHLDLGHHYSIRINAPQSEAG